MLMLWSAPRSRSTAFYRMMMQRDDFTGVHEPFSRAEVFGHVNISGRPLATGAEVIAELRSLAATRQVFIKDTWTIHYLCGQQSLRVWTAGGPRAGVRTGVSGSYPLFHSLVCPQLHSG
jgi:hypothetical protein